MKQQIQTIRYQILGYAILFLVGIIMTPNPLAKPLPLDPFLNRAAAYKAVLTIPPFEKTPEAIAQTVEEIIASTQAAGDAIAAQRAGQPTFNTVIRALDDLHFQFAQVQRRINLIKETSPDPELRLAATAAIKKLADWLVGFSYREDIYQAIEAYASTNPALDGEAAKFYHETLRDYKRMGFGLPKAQRDELEALKKELSLLGTDFRSNITNATAALVFSRAELDGVPESFLNQDGVKTGEDAYTIMANITWHFQTVMSYAKPEETRKKLFYTRFTLAKEENIPLIEKIISLRQTIASKLGYASWADYGIETKMAKNEKTVRSFLENLIQALQPKLDAELAQLKALKAQETGETNPEILFWDWRYYREQLIKTQYAVDTEALRVYFSYDQTLAGMFSIYETVFGIKIQQVENPDPWYKDVALHLVSDAETGAPLGLVYLDMFPRPGKFNHFAQFGIVPGKRLADGRYQRPTVALVCNFPPASGDLPALLTYERVETLFHEFGHCLHSLLTQADFSAFSCTSVPRDFVEVPSQILEYWLENQAVLDTFAADYRDPSQKFPPDALARIIASNRATIGLHYRRQLVFGMIDIAFHGPADRPLDVIRDSNHFFKDVFIPVPDDTSFITYFGHFVGYDAGYYGYAWADVIAADLAMQFETSALGFLNPVLGRRLRDEIFAPGNSRDVNESIRAFLGRDYRFEPFLQRMGVQ